MAITMRRRGKQPIAMAGACKPSSIVFATASLAVISMASRTASVARSLSICVPIIAIIPLQFVGSIGGTTKARAYAGVPEIGAYPLSDCVPRPSDSAFQCADDCGCRPARDGPAARSVAVVLKPKGLADRDIEIDPEPLFQELKGVMH